MSKLYPAHFKEWNSNRSGLHYKVYLRDFPNVSGGQNKSFIDAVRTATDALGNAVHDLNDLPEPSIPQHGDIMIKLDEVTNHGHN